MLPERGESAQADLVAARPLDTVLTAGLLLPDMRHPAALGHRPSQFQRRRVACKDKERAARSRLAESRLQGRRAIMNNLQLLVRDARVLEAHCQFFRLQPAAR